MGIHHSCTAFAGTRRISSGSLADVALHAKEIHRRDPEEQLLIFDDLTGAMVEVDFRGTPEDVVGRLARPLEEDSAADSDMADSKTPRGPGRPKLGVVAREVTLLPRHWEWLNGQPGGASVALRKLVEQARRALADKDRVRQSQEACYRFMSAMAGNLPGFEEATRALFAGEADHFGRHVVAWPQDVRDHAIKLASRALAPDETKAAASNSP